MKGDYGGKKWYGTGEGKVILVVGVVFEHLKLEMTTFMNNLVNHCYNFLKIKQKGDMPQKSWFWWVFRKSYLT